MMLWGADRLTKNISILINELCICFYLHSIQSSYVLAFASSQSSFFGGSFISPPRVGLLVNSESVLHFPILV